jgi:hypothetical protein
MGDDITIGVTEVVNNIEVTAQPNDQIIDIDVIDNSDSVTLNVTPTLIEVNIERGGSFARWGTIYGSILDQTDLQNALFNKADLVNGLVPASQLPSFVDDVIEVANFASLPTSGEIGKIYITLDNNKIYRWGGSTYVEIAANNAVWGSITGTLSNQTDLQNALNAKQATLVSGTNIKTLEGQSLLGSGNIDLSKSDVGLGNVDNTSDANKPISSATQTALDLKANISGQVFTGAISATNLSGTNTGDQDLSGLVPNTRTLTINGTTFDLSANRSWTISAGVWGSITGTLSDQTDLQTALNLKANDADVVKLTGNQTITGTKTFNVSGANNINITNSSTFLGLNITNSSTGKGLQLDNTGLGEGFLLQNQNGRGFTLSNNGTGTGLALFCNGTGSGMFVTLGSSSTKGIEFQGNSGFTGSSIFINNISGSTGNIIRGQRIGSDVFVVDYLGQVGIGTGTPNTPLDVVSNVSARSLNIRNRSANDLANIMFSTNNGSTDNAAIGWTTGRLRFMSGGSGDANERLSILTNGNVGIGTTNPQYILDIHKPANGFLFQFKGGASLATEIRAFLGDTAASFGTATNHPFSLFTNGSDRMTITSGGNVGIGTTSPNFKIHSHSTGINNYIQFTSATTGSTSSDGFIFGTGDNGDAIFLNRENTKSIFYTNNTERLVITADGNVGIGTASPFAPSSSWRTMEIKGSTTSTITGLFARNSDNSAWFGFYLNPTAGATIGTTSVHRLQFVTQDIERIGVETNGNVKINNLGTGLVYSNGGNLTSTNPSDERLKDDITDLQYGLNEILQLRPVSYNWKNDTINQGKQFGFIAQEVQEIMPELISEFTTTENEEEVVRLGLDKEGIYAALVNAIKEQNEVLVKLKSEIDLLKQKA